MVGRDTSVPVSPVWLYGCMAALVCVAHPVSLTCSCSPARTCLCGCSSLARTHLFFPLFGEVNGKTGTPIYATIFVLIATLPLSILTDLPPLIDMVSAGECGRECCVLTRAVLNPSTYAS